MSSTISYHGDTILVTGATGRQGGAVARHLLKNGWKVRALTRNTRTDEAQTLAKEGAYLVQGDLEDQHSMFAALSGVHGVFSVQTFTERGIDAEIKQGKTLAKAARQAGVKHLVYSSALYADMLTGVPQWDSKAEIEMYLHTLGLPVTIFRPAAFMEDFLQAESLKRLLRGKISLPLRPLCIQQYVALDDLAAFVVKAFEQPRHFVGEEIRLAGDELNMNETTAVFARVLDTDLTYKPVPRIVSRFRMTREYSKMYQWLDRRKSDDTSGANIPDLRSQHPDLLSLESWLYRRQSNGLPKAIDATR